MKPHLALIFSIQKLTNSILITFIEDLGLRQKSVSAL